MIPVLKGRGTMLVTTVGVAMLTCGYGITRPVNRALLDSVSAAQAELGIPLRSQTISLPEVDLHVVTAGPRAGDPVILPILSRTRAARNACLVGGRSGPILI